MVACKQIQISNLHEGRGRYAGKRHSCCCDQAFRRHRNPLKQIPLPVPKVGCEAQAFQQRIEGRDKPIAAATPVAGLAALSGWEIV